jgi:hypothetical protein
VNLSDYLNWITAHQEQIVSVVRSVPTATRNPQSLWPALTNWLEDLLQ